MQIDTEICQSLGSWGIMGNTSKSPREAIQDPKIGSVENSILRAKEVYNWQVYKTKDKIHVIGR